MLRVGLTGGIGAGKSTVAARLVEHGAVLVDSDVLAREVLDRGSPGLAAVVAEFGAGVLTAEGALDRPALAAVAFASDERRRALNAIVHPLVGARAAELIAAAPPESVVVQDVPLLVENGAGPAFALVVVVDAPEPVRLQRLMSARGMVEADARARIRAQAGDAQRRAAADVWLDNSGAPGAVLDELDRVWDHRIAPFAEHLRAGTWPRNAPVLVEADPTWPVQAARLRARLQLACGAHALRVDHIGSTAVPNLPAKDVIDLQVTVASLAEADALADAVVAAGFPRHTITADTPRAAHPDPADWAKRLHVHADPERAANVHVRVDGSPGQRFALLFGDWLRAEADVRAEYLAVKRRATQGAAEVLDYAAAKEPWFDTAYPRAWAWAQLTGWTSS